VSLSVFGTNISLPFKFGLLVVTTEKFI